MEESRAARLLARSLRVELAALYLAERGLDASAVSVYAEPAPASNPGYYSLAASGILAGCDTCDLCVIDAAYAAYRVCPVAARELATRLAGYIESVASGKKRKKIYIRAAAWTAAAAVLTPMLYMLRTLHRAAMLAARAGDGEAAARLFHYAAMARWKQSVAPARLVAFLRSVGLVDEPLGRPSPMRVRYTSALIEPLAAARRATMGCRRI